MGPDELQLPPELPNWQVVKEALQELRGKLVNKTTRLKEVGWFMHVIYNTIQSDQRSHGKVDSQLTLLKAKVQAKDKQKLDNACHWYGVLKFLNKVPTEEKDQFMNSTLPSIVEYALKIEDFMKRERVVWSKQQKGGKIILSRRFVCSIMACFFLCLFPERKKHSDSPVNIVNFTDFFKHLPDVTQIAKLRCVLHYFECVIQHNMDIDGNVVFHRKVASSDWTLNFNQLMECDLPLCPVQVSADGKMEDSGREIIQVCFGNKSLGGGVLGKSKVQEEIKFITCPELIAAMLMMENMDDNEAIEISGFEQMACYRGYGKSFQYAGHCDGVLCDSGRFYTVTIDATSYRNKDPRKQYEEEYVLRDLNKALVGFCDASCDQINVEESKSWENQSDVTNKRKISASKKNRPEPSASPASFRQHHRLESAQSFAEPEEVRKLELREEHLHRDERQVEPSTESCWQRIGYFPQIPLSDLVSDETPGLSRIPSSDAPSPAIPPAMAASSSPLPIPSACSETVARGSSPTWPHLDSQTNPFPIAAGPPQQASSIHSNFEPTAEWVILSSDDVSVVADSAIGTELYSQIDSEQCQSLPSALSDPPLFSAREGKSSGAAAKFYSDVLGNLTTASSGANNPPTYPLTLFQPADPVETTTDHHSRHSSQPLLEATSSRTSKRDAMLRQSAFSSFESEPRGLSQIKYQEVEKAGSDISNYSTKVCVDSQRASLHSLDECSRNADPLLLADSLTALANKSSSPRMPSFPMEKVVSVPSHSLLYQSNAPTHLEPPRSSSPVSSASSLNQSANSSFGVQETSLGKPRHFQPAEVPKNGTKDFYQEGRDWMSASSSSSIVPGPSVSSNEGSRRESRSGSLSSHGTSGSHHDMNDLWTGQRRRSSQMSDVSRRSSSSKHSSDLGTDLEEISETPAKQGHTVIEEEGSQTALNMDLDEMDAAAYLPGVDGIHEGESDRQTDPSLEQPSKDWNGELDGMATHDDARVSGSGVEEMVTLTDQADTYGQPPKDQAGVVNVEISSEPQLATTGDRPRNIPSPTSADAVARSELTLPVPRSNDSPERREFDPKVLGNIGPIDSTSKSNGPKVAWGFEEETADPRNNVSVPIDESVSLETSDSDFVSGTSYTTLPSKTVLLECEVKHYSYQDRSDVSRKEQVQSEAISSDFLSTKSVFSALSLRQERESHSSSRHFVNQHTDGTSQGMELEVKSYSTSPTTASKQTPSGKEVFCCPERDFYVSPSRYLFSDVASAPSDQSKHEYRAISPIPTGKGGFLQNMPEFRNAHMTHENVKGTHFTSALISLFVSNLAKIAVSEACNEVAKVNAQLSQKGVEKEIISDEIYTMFATDIVNQVFVHILSSIESRDSESPLSSLSLNIPPPEDIVSSNGTDKPRFQMPALEGSPESSSSLTSPSYSNANYLTCLFHPKSTIDLSSQREVTPFKPLTALYKSAPSLTPVNSKPSSQKPKNSSALITKASGICKTVSFEDTCVEAARSDAGSPVSGLAQPDDDNPLMSTSLSTVFQRPSSNLPGSNLSSFAKDAGATAFSQPSLDLGVSTSAASPSMPRLSHSQSALELTYRHSLTPSDYDIYQTATAIVNQVFQSISDSLGKDSSWANLAGFNDVSTVDSSLSTVSVSSCRRGQGEAFTSNIFSSSPIKTHHHSSSRYSSHSPSMVVSRKPMSREGVTNAFLKVDSTPSVKSYERRSSEPCHTSVQLSLQAFNDNRFSCKQKEEKQSKHCSTDDEIHHERKWRRGSLDGFSFEQRRNSCGFKDPVLSRFAEELMKADTSVPELVIFGSRQNSSTTGSRRSSISGFKDMTLANLESELLNTSFTSICSLPLSQSPRSQHWHSRASGRSRSWELRQGKSDSSDTEHIFPIPSIVGYEFRQQYNKQYGHDDDDKDASGSTNSVVMASRSFEHTFQWDPHLQTEEERAMDDFAASLSDHILREAFSCHFVEGEDIPDAKVDADYHLSAEDINSDSKVVSGNLSISVDGDMPVYFGEGARPKTASEPRRTSSKARAIPRRKFEGRYREDSASSDGFGYNSVSSKGRALSATARRQPSRSSSADLKERKACLPMFKRLVSQDRHVGDASQRSISTSSVPAALTMLPSDSLPVVVFAVNQSKGHQQHHLLPSKSFSIQLSGSSSDVTSSSMTSDYRAPRREEEKRRWASSEASYTHENAARPAAEAEDDRAHLDKWPLVYESGHNDSMDSFLSLCSDSSTHSGQTRSSVLSSSLSDSEGSKSRSDGGKAKVSHAERKKRMAARQVKEASKAVSSSGSQWRSRRERGRKRSLTKPRQKKFSREMAYHFLYAEELCKSIVAEALKDFKQLKWKRYLSYNKAIATGNWGCGAFKGNPQLKLVIQWIAASVAKTPILLYYSFGESRLNQAQEVIRELSSWSVSELSMALREYCLWAQGHTSDPRMYTSYSYAKSWFCGRQPEASLFDYLLNFHKNREHPRRQTQHIV